MKDLQQYLVAYGTHLLASQLGQTWPPPSQSPTPRSLAEQALQNLETYSQDERLRLAREIVYDSSLEPGLPPISEPKPVTPVFHLLSLPPHVTPPDQDSSSDSISPSVLWSGFWDALNQLRAQSAFDAFFYLMAHYGRQVSGTVEDTPWSGFEIGISVSEQFKAIAALCHCLDPALGDDQKIGLVAGDLPGIQRVLYTITSRGAAKTLRGRSAYLQLLGDAIVRCLLRAMDLSWANVVFNAGGSFLLLVPGAKKTEIAQQEKWISQRLLDLHRAELHLALAHVEIQASRVSDPSHQAVPGGLNYARRELQRQLVAAKDAPFASLLDDPAVADVLFKPFGTGGPAYMTGERSNLCAICQVEVSQEHGTQISIHDEQQEEIEQEPEIEMVLCEQCHSLGSHRVQDDNWQEILPYQLAHAESVFIEPVAPVPLPDKYLSPDGGTGNPAWDKALETLGFRYEFRWPGKTPAPQPLAGKQGYLLHLNRDKFGVGTEPGIAYGFWPMASLTPWRNDHQDTIRDFHLMADYDATGVPRYGVLRMDVDDLGRTLSGTALRHPDLLHLSAFSAALNDFFGSRLVPICRQAVANWQEELGKLDKHDDPPKGVSDSDRKLPYVIYAGGDDLFTVGPWDLLPHLAQEIRHAFDVYTSHRLTMSAGISLARPKYPLYKSAEDAGSALDQSKISPGKDALTFLGKTLNWPDGREAQCKALAISKLISLGVAGDDGRRSFAPHALLNVLGYVAYLYQTEAHPTETAASDGVALGRWLWALHYGLRRMGQRVKEPLRSKIHDLAGKVVLNIDDLEAARAFRPIRYLDLTVRWAEFTIRKGGDH
jgi:CRISPR-associated protein Csm1